MRRITTIFISTAAACALMLSGCTSGKMSDAAKQEQQEKQEQQAAWESYSAAQETRDFRAEKVPDSDAPEAYIVTIYMPKKNGKGLNEVVDDIEKKTGDALFAKLKEYGVVSGEATLTAYTEKDGEATMEITGAGALSELQIQAISETYEESFALTKLVVVADGETVIDETYETAAPAGPGVQ